MSTSTGSANPGTVKLTDLHEKQRAVLRAVNEHNGKTNTSEIREWTGITGSLASYHIDRVVDDGLLEHVGTADVGAPEPAKVYRLTDEGKDLVDADRDGTPHEPLADRVRRLERENKRLREENERLSNEVAALSETVEQFGRRLERVEEQSGTDDPFSAV